LLIPTLIGRFELQFFLLSWLYHCWKPSPTPHSGLKSTRLLKDYDPKQDQSRSNKDHPIGWSLLLHHFKWVWRSRHRADSCCRPQIRNLRVFVRWQPDCTLRWSFAL